MRGISGPFSAAAQLVAEHESSVGSGPIPQVISVSGAGVAKQHDGHDPPASHSPSVRNMVRMMEDGGWKTGDVYVVTPSSFHLLMGLAWDYVAGNPMGFVYRWGGHG